MWESFVDVVRATMFAGTHVFNGSLGTSIFVVSALARLALLPLTLRIARQARATQAKLLALEPRLARIRKRHANDPGRVLVETQDLYREHGIRAFTPGSVASMAVQMPLLGGLYSAVRSGLGSRVRFLWVSDLARPDSLLIALAVALSAGAASIAPAAPAAPVAARVTVTIVLGTTFFFLWHASSAMALSVSAGSLVSAVQSWALRREIANTRK
jgi:YidC/Oxa1 family membrane protein insertase